MKHSISAIIPNYNYARYLKRRLDSVLTQTVPVSEVLLLDDASTDDSLEVAKHYLDRPNLHLITNQRNSGSAFAQWAAGVRAASGDLIWIAEADDWAEPCFLEKLLPFFQHPDAQPVLAYSASRAIDGEDAVIYEDYTTSQYLMDISSLRWNQSYLCEGTEEIRKALCVKNTILNVSSVLFDRRALVALLDEQFPSIINLRMVGDWYIYYELLRKNKVAYQAEILNSHRRHQQSVTIHSSNTALQLLREVRIMHEHMLRSSSLPEECVYRIFDHELQHFAANPDMPKKDFLAIADWNSLWKIWKAGGSPSKACKVFIPEKMIWLNQVTEAQKSHGISRGMEAFWNNQFPPRVPSSLESEEDFELFHVWWQMRWRWLVPYLADPARRDIPSSLLKAYSSQGSFPVPRWAYLFLKSSAELKQRFSLENEVQAVKYIYWLVTDIQNNRRENALHTFYYDLLDWLAEPREASDDVPRILLAHADDILRATQGKQAPQTFPYAEEDWEMVFVWWQMRWRWDVPHCDKGMHGKTPPSLLGLYSFKDSFPVPRWAYLFLQGAPSLKETFCLVNEVEAVKYILWLAADICNKGHEAVLYDFYGVLLDWLAAPCKKALEFPRFMLDVAVNSEPDIIECAGMVCRGLCQCGAIFPDLSLFRISYITINRLLSPIPEDNDGVPLFYKGLMHWRQDAQGHYPRWKSPEDLKKILQWISWEQNSNPHRHPLLNSLFDKLEEQLEDNSIKDSPCVGGNPDKEKLPLVLNAQIPLFRDTRLFRGTLESGGVNVVGFAKGTLGIGEDARMAACALKHAKVAARIYSPPMDIPSTQTDASAEAFLCEAPVYRTNILYIPASETLRLYMQDGPGIFNFRYNICAWQWELPHFPVTLRGALPLGQEFWASSTFTANAVRKITDSPVLYMPMAVTLPNFTQLGRRAHNLPENTFLFLYVFDGLSWGSRKNPMAAIRAFQAAFSATDDVRLIIKTMHATRDMPFWRAVLKAEAQDPRILCINEVCTKQQLLSLFACCDAYVSLHRAEGFGRTIAEAMLLERPVIATAWSGNADFTTPETAFAVGGKLVPVREGEYIFWEGQEWCEPDHEAAVWAMRECVANPALAKAKAQAGRQLILERYSASAVGLRYRKRLETLGIL